MGTDDKSTKDDFTPDDVGFAVTATLLLAVMAVVAAIAAGAF